MLFLFDGFQNHSNELSYGLRTSLLLGFQLKEKKGPVIDVLWAYCSRPSRRSFFQWKELVLFPLDILMKYNDSLVKRVQLLNWGNVRD